MFVTAEERISRSVYVDALTIVIVLAVVNHVGF